MKKQEVIIVKGNPLIEAKHDFMSVTEYRLILTAISKINKFTSILEPIEFTLEEFCKLMNIEKRGVLKNVKRNCEILRKKGVSIQINEKWETHTWVKSIEYEKGKIRIWINDLLADYLLFSKKNKAYTKYLLRIILKFNRYYSIRLYEILKQYQRIGKRKLSIKEIKQHLGISANMYKQYKDFKKQVIFPILNELNTLSDINVDFQEIKISRKVVGFIFEIKSNFDFNDNYTTKYQEMPKIKLNDLLKKYFYEKTGYDIPAKLFLNYHKLILQALLNKIDSGNFNNVLIENPYGFVAWHLKDIQLNYDQKKLRNVEDN